MLPKEKQALRVLVTSIFNGHTRGSSDTATVKIVLADILEQTKVVLADVQYQWNRSNGSLVLPLEVLAICIAFLPFQCRITASHVSRAWRTAALSSPAIWAEVIHPKSSGSLSGAVIYMALRRAGTMPIRFKYLAPLNPTVEKVLQSFIGRIKSLAIHTNLETQFFNKAAPLMESLSLTRASITTGFLGGRVGRLTILRAHHLLLPSTCRALSTVTELSGSFTIDGRRGNLFALFPCLQSLSILKLSRENADPRLFGQAPSSLVKLELETQSVHSDIISVYNASNVNSLRDVRLRFPAGKGHSHDVGRLLDGAVSLRVEGTYSPDLITLTVDFPDGRHHTISIKDMVKLHCDYSRYTDARRTFPPIFAQCAANISLLQTLTIPINVLSTFIMDAPPLPALAELRLQIAGDMPLKFDSGWRGSRFPWSLLHLLSDVHVPRIFLDVVCSSDGKEKEIGPQANGPTTSDARAMLAELIASRLSTPGSSSITVCGFALDAVRHVEIPECLVGCLTFDVN